jgi:glutathione S-transferase
MGETFTMADIAAVTIIDFAALIGMAPLCDRTSAEAWYDRVTKRPSCRA